MNFIETTAYKGKRFELKHWEKIRHLRNTNDSCEFKKKIVSDFKSTSFTQTIQ